MADIITEVTGVNIMLTPGTILKSTITDGSGRCNVQHNDILILGSGIVIPRSGRRMDRSGTAIGGKAKQGI